MGQSRAENSSEDIGLFIGHDRHPYIMLRDKGINIVAEILQVGKMDVEIGHRICLREIVAELRQFFPGVGFRPFHHRHQKDIAGRITERFHQGADRDYVVTLECAES